MNNPLRQFQASLEHAIYGETPEGHCVDCKQKFTTKNCRTVAEIRESKISKLCGLCWDKLFS